MIEVTGLSKSYRERQAVSNVTFSVKRGEILGFLGPNGAGKSTTMKILSGLLVADSGTASISGINVRENPKAAKNILGYLPETPPVYLGMEVADYLDFAACLHHVPKDKRKAAIDRALASCDLGSVRNRIIGHLSKGFRQRVGLAQAIVHNPPVLILDEPTVGLDPKQIIEIRNLIRSFSGEHTVIFSTHILSEVKATCDRVVVIDRGKVVAEDTLEGLTARASSDQSVNVTVSRDPVAVLDKLRGLTGVVGVNATASDGSHRIRIDCQKGKDPRAEVAEILVSGKLGLLELSIARASLEDAFVKLVSQEKEGERHVP